MSRELDDQSSDILNFRPVIEFVEPDQEPGEIIPDIPIVDQAQVFDDRVANLENLANAVDVLAAAVQARVDKKAAGLRIKLDPNVDAAAIAALQREFGEQEPPFFIDYDQYRHCRDHIRQKGEENSVKAMIGPPHGGLPGGWGTVESREGGLRPELSKKAQIVEPLDIDAFQNYLIRILINFLWKKFIKPTFKPIGIPGLGNLADALPDQLAKVPDAINNQMKNLGKLGVPLLD